MEKWVPLILAEEEPLFIHEGNYIRNTSAYQENSGFREVVLSKSDLKNISTPSPYWVKDPPLPLFAFYLTKF